jgi:excinuclease UvrABC ATPase subunit
MEADPDLVVPDKTLSIHEGAIKPWSNSQRTDSYYNKLLAGVANHYGFKLDVPYHTLSQEHKDVILYGSGDENITFTFERAGKLRNVTKPFEGVIPYMKRLFIETKSRYRRKAARTYMSLNDCPMCHGDRLKPEMLAVTVGDINIADLTKLSLSDCQEFFENLKRNFDQRRNQQGNTTRGYNNPNMHAERGGGTKQDDMEYNARKKANQEEIDAILDKIRKSGYDSLTKEEKKKLFDASNNR